jgi:hypothetical protein
MATVTQNFEMFIADTKDIWVTVTDVNLVPVDLAGASITWELSASDWKTAGGSPILTKASPNEIETMSPLDAGVFVVHVESADTEGFVPGSYYHEAQVTLADGTVGTVITGKVKMKQNLVTPR